MRKRQPYNNYIADYWVKHYLSPDHHCSLCGNSGKIDTTQTARTAAGVWTGRVNYCICPNGQVMRKKGAKL